MTTCTNCEAETADGQYLCATDRVTLYRTLCRVRDTLETAGGTLTNQAVAPVNTGGGGGATVAGMPLNLTMLDRAAHYREIIGSWSQLVAEATNQAAPVDVLNRAAWLARQTEAVARHEWAGDMLQELRAAERAVINAADRHGSKITLGTCDALIINDHGGIIRCDGNVTGREGDDRATCDTCETQHSSRERQTTAFSNAWHVIAPLPRVVRALNAAGYPVKYETAKKWVQRGKLATLCDLQTRVEGVSAAAVHALLRT